MEDPLHPDDCARRLRALADPVRLRIVVTLSEGEANVSKLAKRLELPIVTLSHHLGVLRSAALVEGVRHGRHIIYRLSAGLHEGNSGSLCLDLGCCRLQWPEQ